MTVFLSYHLFSRRPNHSIQHRVPALAGLCGVTSLLIYVVTCEVAISLSNPVPFPPKIDVALQLPPCPPSPSQSAPRTLKYP